jgi:nitrogen regulatory protein PII
MSVCPCKIKITIIIDRQVSETVIDELASLGIERFYSEPGRTSILEEKYGLSSFLSRRKLSNSPVNKITFFISNDAEYSLMNNLAVKFNFNSPGKGTIFSNDIEWIKSHKLCLDDAQAINNIALKTNAYMFDELKGLCCIVQRGEGDSIARICLDSGAGVPLITFGTGGGLRDNLGLLRITIPAEKELVNIVMSKYDIDSLMEIIIEQGKMNEPGRGFIYMYQVRKGIVDTKISRGRRGQVASMEKVVSAIDSIKGTMEWRKSRFEERKNKRRHYFENLFDLVLICNEGYSVPLMKAVMAAGATGSTISQVNYHSQSDRAGRIPSNRELCRTVVSKNQVPAIADAVEKAGGFSDKVQGLMYMIPAPKAFTYSS